MNNKEHKNKGFMLYEVLVYLALLGFFVSVFVPEAFAIMINGQKEHTQIQIMDELLFITRQLDAIFRTMQVVSVDTSQGEIVLTDGVLFKKICLRDSVFYLDCVNRRNAISNPETAIKNFMITGTPVTMNISFTYETQAYEYIH